MFSTVEEAIADIKAGKMLVLVDDETRENEGDIIFAAEAATPEKINFILSHARGVICTPISRQIAEHFKLPLMVEHNSSNHETPFTITVDASEASTGVSSFERCLTIRKFIEPNATAKDFVRPGHINPLIAKDGGVLERTGHTEGTVDLCALAGFSKAGVLCEILNDDGTMARRDDLAKFCQKWDLKMISIEQLINYRLRTDSLVHILKTSDYELAGHPCRLIELKDHHNQIHHAYDFAKSTEASGDTLKTRLIKFAKSSLGLANFSSKDLNDTLEAINVLAKNEGVLIHLASSKSDDKNYGIGAQVLKALKISQIKLLNHSSSEAFSALAGFEINIIKE